MSCFHRFQQSVDHLGLPEKFTFPFFYQPHPLAVLAAEQLMQTLEQPRSPFTHQFGLNNTPGTGKMFGVLVVRNQHGELGYLAGFSGKIDDSNHHLGFVPPVFDMLSREGFFRQEMVEINAVTAALTSAQQDIALPELKQQLHIIEQQAGQEIEALRLETVQRRAERKQRRQASLAMQPPLSTEQFNELNQQLGKQSVADKNALKHLKGRWQSKIEQVSSVLNSKVSEIEELKQQRATLSNRLQHQLFRHYRFLNARLEQRDLVDIFASTSNPVPPAGSGECAAPKLLHFAYQNQLTPIALGEFWWGESPKSEIRKHKQFYPACQSKCHPILSHMLEGLEVDDNPLLTNPAKDQELDILYQDDAIVVVNKPANFLSVPGKHIKDSAYTRLQQQFSDVEGPFVIHRLDMATSGLLVFALTRRANKSLQKQFISRSVSKRYIAKIAAAVSSQHGEIHLPMRGDPNDRPRQLVCFEHGKPAHTTWEIKHQDSSGTTLYLYPHTGRTHQLRVHCAHQDGFDSPILGDTLYGQPAERLYLHAESLSFEHPYTKQAMHFQVDAAF
ncbi:pseudouridine synthase [Vibrio sp. WXL103]|uniref:RluA family pseudouridine synthase n=1 Tax=Vibrio sp. WXL103 TaxID=3450710 RepID=UPI003EC87A40